MDSFLDLDISFPTSGYFKGKANLGQISSFFNFTIRCQIQKTNSCMNQLNHEETIDGLLTI